MTGLTELGRFYFAVLVLWFAFGVWWNWPLRRNPILMGFVPVFVLLVILGYQVFLVHP